MPWLAREVRAIGKSRKLVVLHLNKLFFLPKVFLPCVFHDEFIMAVKDHRSKRAMSVAAAWRCPKARCSTDHWDLGRRCESLRGLLVTSTFQVAALKEFFWATQNHIDPKEDIHHDLSGMEADFGQLQRIVIDISCVDLGRLDFYEVFEIWTRYRSHDPMPDSHGSRQVATAVWLFSHQGRCKQQNRMKRWVFSAATWWFHHQAAAPNLAFWGLSIHVVQLGLFGPSLKKCCVF